MTTANKTTEAGERTQRESVLTSPVMSGGEYLAPNKHVHIYKPDMHPIDKMIRLYSTQWATSWKLQVRGPLSVACNGTREGKSSVIASVDLSLDQMISLRAALGEFISEAQAAISKAEGK